RSTAELVGRVSRLCQEKPAVARELLDGIGALAERAEGALASGEVAMLGRLLDDNHRALQALGVSSPELDELCTRARAAGALGAKLTGAGGGGAAIALAPGREAAVLAAWRANGYAGFTT